MSSQVSCVYSLCFQCFPALWRMLQYSNIIPSAGTHIAHLDNIYIVCTAHIGNQDFYMNVVSLYLQILSNPRLTWSPAWWRGRSPPARSWGRSTPPSCPPPPGTPPTPGPRSSEAGPPPTETGTRYHIFSCFGFFIQIFIIFRYTFFSW